MTAPATTDTPDKKNLVYQAQEHAWGMVDDVLQGTAAVRKKGEEYTPRAQGESLEKYERRLKRSRFYNIYRRTLGGMTGRVFRTPPKLAKDAPKELLEHAENIDGKGTHVSIFARRLFRKGLHHGHGVILIDTPPDPARELGRKPTRLDDQVRGMRPYWIIIPATAVWDFSTAVVAGREVLAHIVIYQRVAKRKGRFTEVEVEQWRVYERVPNGVVYEVWEKQDSKEGEKQVVMLNSGRINRVTEIPVVPFYATEPEGWFHSTPMLSDVAETNLDHYAVQSDHRFSLHVASIPIPYMTGVEPNSVVEFSVEKGIRIAAPEAKVGFLEHAGKALGESRSEMHDLEDRMAMLGLQAMSRRSRTAETAEAKRIDQLEQESMLSIAARGLQDALEQAWQIHSQMIGVNAPSITINFNFDGLSLSPEKLREMRETWLAGGISRETFWDLLENGGELPEDFNRGKERDRIEGEQMPPTPVTPIGSGKRKSKKGADQIDPNPDGQPVEKPVGAAA